MIYKGSCHCGAVTFSVEAPEQFDAINCNCSMCSKTGFLHLIVPKTKFTLLSGADKITTYTFNTGIAKHTFCSICGVKAFYTPRSNPDGIDVNARCLEPQPKSMSLSSFDGKNWEDNESLAHLSQE